MATAIQRIQAIVPRAGIVETYPDSDRYKFGFAVASESSGRKYKISFDAAPGCLYWKCSCPGCIGRKGHPTCKHLRACGLMGGDGGRQLDFAKRHGFIT